MGFLVPLNSMAGQWTNAAGHAISAEFIGVRGSTVEFETPEGRLFSIPLAGLSVASRDRIAAFSGESPIPSVLSIEFSQCVRVLRRMNELRRMERLSADEFETRRQAVLESFIRACRKINMTDETGALMVAAAERRAVQ